MIAYSSFAKPPPASSLFGRVGTGPRAGAGTPGAGLQVLCVNPAAPTGGSALLSPYFPTLRVPRAARHGRRARCRRPPTPWVSYPDRYSAVCKSRGGATWLQSRRSRTTCGPPWPDARPDVGAPPLRLQYRARRSGHARRPRPPPTNSSVSIVGFATERRLRRDRRATPRNLAGMCRNITELRVSNRPQPVRRSKPPRGSTSAR